MTITRIARETTRARLDAFQAATNEAFSVREAADLALGASYNDWEALARAISADGAYQALQSATEAAWHDACAAEAEDVEAGGLPPALTLGAWD